MIDIKPNRYIEESLKLFPLLILNTVLDVKLNIELNSINVIVL